MASIPSSSAIAEAERLVSSLKAHTGSPSDQAEVVRQLEKVRCHVHQGPDAMMFHAFPFHVLPALKVLLDFGVFDAAPIDGSISVEELATAAGIDAAILFRNIRLLLTQGIFKETAPSILEHTAASAIFRGDQAANFYRLGTMQFPQWWKVSDYLKTHTPAETQEATKAPYSWAVGKEGKTYYEVIEEDPVFSDAWHKGIMMNEAAQPVTGMFPFHAMKGSVEAEPHRAFVVDVGGGRGNALKAIMKECEGNYGAKMVLQDMEEVLKGKDPVHMDGVDIMPYNFYEEQPVKNAHIYFMRFCLHNHYDDRSRRILRNTAKAMGPTSRLLIGEMILPTSAAPGSDPFPFVMDLNMFMESGLERTEEHWGELLSDVGLRIEKIWRLPGNPVLGTIETVLQN